MRKSQTAIVYTRQNKEIFPTINSTVIVFWFLFTSTYYIYVIYRLRGPDEKNCARGLENGPSPKGEGRFQDRGHSFSHPDRSCR